MFLECLQLLRSRLRLYDPLILIGPGYVFWNMLGFLYSNVDRVDYCQQYRCKYGRPKEKLKRFHFATNSYVYLQGGRQTFNEVGKVESELGCVCARRRQSAVIKCYRSVTKVSIGRATIGSNLGV